MDDIEAIRARKMADLMAESQMQNAGPMDAIDHPVEVTDRTFEGEVQKHEFIVIDAWAPWCGPCKMLAPIIEALAKENAGKVVFGKLNTDQNPKISMKYGIMSIPTLLYFKNGQLVHKSVGAMPKNQLDSIIQQLSNQ